MWTPEEIEQFKGKGVTAYAPGSIGNVSVGFDVLGLAINAPGDLVTVVPNDSGKVEILEISSPDFELSKTVERNTAGMAARSVLRQLGTSKGVSLYLDKKMPLGSGMGSSAASAVAAALATAAALEANPDKSDLLEACLDGEQVASGARHGDNAFPCLLGGILLVRGTKKGEITSLPIPEGLSYAVVHPDIQVLTSEAREIMPKSYPRSVLVHQMANLGGFIASLYRGDFDLMRRSLRDEVAEPYRKENITGFEAARIAALQEGAIGFGISGSGPSVFALCESEIDAERVARAISFQFGQLQIRNRSYTGTVNTEGACIV